MIDFMLVDDEYLERILISKSFAWEENGFKQVAAVSNGEEGLEAFKKFHPSLVLTDINMPFMDGLELARQIKRLSPKTEVVIITGFSEFDYARQAVNIGVDSFLLKPINRDELCDAAIKAKQKIIDRESKDNDVLKMRQQLEQTMPIVTESFLQRLVCGRVSQLEFNERISKDAALSPLAGSIVCAFSNPVPDTTAQADMYTFPENWIFLSFNYYQGGRVLLISVPDGLCDAEEKIEQAIASSPAACSHYIGVSEVFCDIDGIVTAFQQSVETAGALELINQCGVACYSKLLESQKNPDQNMQSAALLQDYSICLKNCQWDSARDLALRCFADMVCTNENDVGMIRLALLRILTISSMVLADKGCTLSEMPDGDVLKITARVRQPQEARDELIRMLQMCKESYLSTNISHRSKLVNSVVEYIDEHFCDAELSLKTIAREFYINDSYLSRVFKNEMEKGLVEYITECRIVKALDLLKDCSLKSYQVAEMIGINDPHYFGQCFKRQMGVTVNQFRQSLNKC